jgi:hypothetical protein
VIAVEIMQLVCVSVFRNEWNLLLVDPEQQRFGNAPVFKTFPFLGNLARRYEVMGK